ncbi:MAG: DUF1614 domain-containing protein [Firmicutes bacterium]|nr:DUF1614 domain-containing protein [Bacillota bacterium]
MTQLPIGLIVLILVSVLIYFGLAQRVLDRLRLSDRAAFLIIAALIVGSFITIPLSTGRYDVSLNVGGALVPIILAGYLLSKAGTSKEWIRAVVATFITAGVIYGAGFAFGGVNAEPGGRLFGSLDAIWAYPLIAGIVAYVAGRSRRSAFIAATLGLVLVDLAYLVWLTTGGAPAGTVAIGGAGAFDAIVLAGVFAVLLAEVIGEVRERIQGGPSSHRPDAVIKGLKSPESGGLGAKALGSEEYSKELTAGDETPDKDRDKRGKQE